jgi:hypothetical protein
MGVASQQRAPHSSCGPRLDLLQDLYEAHYVRLLEHAFDTVAVEIREGRLVQRSRVRHAARREMIDHEVDEFELIRSEPAAVQEVSKGTFGRFAVGTHQGADEARKPAVRPQRAERRFIDAGIEEDTLKLAEIGRRQRFVAPDLPFAAAFPISLMKRALTASVRPTSAWKLGSAKSAASVGLQEG